MDIIMFTGQKNFTKCAKKIINDHEIYHNCTVIETVDKKTEEIAEDHFHRGAKIFIARGQNFNRLKNKYPVPIVEVRCSYEEILKAYHAAECHQKPIGIIGYGTIYDKIVTVKENSKLNFTPLRFTNSTEIYPVLEKAKAEGIEVIVGGLSTKRVCDELGLIHVMHHINPKCLKDALDEAESLLAVTKEKNKQFNFVQTMVNMSAESVLAFDEHLQIQFLNHAASKTLRFLPKEKLIASLWSEENYRRIFLENDEITNKVIDIDKQKYAYSLFPLLVDGKPYGGAAYLKNLMDQLSTESLLRKQLSTKGHVATKTFDDIIGTSPSLKETIRWAKKVAKSDNSVLITGETGTGKELFAQSIHNYSNRHSGPFIAINCAALSSSVLESELFGYVKGAFTGASQEGKIGIFELAHNGTVFLDEIGEISLEVQAKLLRVLQEKEIVRVGGETVIPVDVRVISATNRNLKDLSQKNKFRKDLYYRLTTLDIKIPSLRERSEDIPDLIRNYLANYYPDMFIHPNSLTHFKNFRYDGNIRQLINLIERCVVMSDGHEIEHRTVVNICQQEFSEDLISAKLPDNIQEFNQEGFEKQELIAALKKNLWHKSKTAKDLGISTTTLWRKMKKHNIF